MSNIQNIDQHIIINVAERIERLIKDARQHINRIVDITEVITKYEIGHVIIEVVQEGEDRARYGKQLLKGVSEILTERLGEGWSVDTLKKCRKFYRVPMCLDMITCSDVAPTIRMMFMATESVEYCKSQSPISLTYCKVTIYFCSIS